MGEARPVPRHVRVQRPAVDDHSAAFVSDKDAVRARRRAHPLQSQVFPVTSHHVSVPCLGAGGEEKEGVSISCIAAVVRPKTEGGEGLRMNLAHVLSWNIVASKGGRGSCLVFHTGKAGKAKRADKRAKRKKITKTKLTKSTPGEHQPKRMQDTYCCTIIRPNNSNNSYSHGCSGQQTLPLTRYSTL